MLLRCRCSLSNVDESGVRCIVVDFDMHVVCLMFSGASVLDID